MNTRSHTVLAPHAGQKYNAQHSYCVVFKLCAWNGQTRVSILRVNRYNGNSWEFFKCYPASLTEHENVPVWNGFVDAQAVLCPYMLTSRIAEHSWDRLEPESASSLCEHENRGWGLRLQTKDGFLNPPSCGTELHSQRRAQSELETLSWTKLPFLRESQHLCIVVTATVFFHSHCFKTICQRQTQSHVCCDVFFFLRTQKSSHHYSHIFCFFPHYKDKRVLRLPQSVFINEKEKNICSQLLERWIMCLLRGMREVPKKTERLG